MQTDKELLEMAARAAGYEPVRMADNPHEGSGLMLAGIQEAWNPLTDDGDALRLAVKLQFRVDASHDQTDVTDLNETFVCCEVYSADPCAATRRAIVRAAASIGLQLGEQTQ